jgi:ATP-dependent helicase STH1/SNF2
LEEGEDIQEIAERARAKKERRLAKALGEDSARGTPASDGETRGRKKKGKAKADYAPIITNKRKRAIKSLTPSIDDEEEEEEREREQVCVFFS